MEEKMFQVAIDGPAGAGKSTIAKILAADLGFIYVDTGAMYRAMALSCLRNGIDVRDKEAVVGHCEKIEVSLKYKNGEQQVLLNGENVNAYIRTEEVSQATSAISIYEGVREKLLNLQRQLGQEHNVVMDGRDIGTNVLKDAQVKIYLTASVNTRAKRRYEELVKRGIECNLKEIEEDIKERDYRDMHREIAPLKQAEQAVYLDSSELAIEQVVGKIREMIEDRKSYEGNSC
ncbi:MAG: (d)CMP kinase [Lachnospiraceae bacterium]|nr:(d)CMP kinase [Lachnospiraceae bacterium]MCI8826013.1 (d)CMP kinase [Lachnospiraceae bacterium]MCI9370543.1 (d)CMP kinase [Lachnospiraceae bacterium]